VRHDSNNQGFEEQVTQFVDRLAQNKETLKALRASGGTTCIIVQFLGDGYFGDSIPRKTLAKMIDLELDFAIEVYTSPQT